MAESWLKVYFKGDAYPVEVDDELAANGWPPGQGVQWAKGPDGAFTVGRSNGYFAGFLLKGSDDPLDTLTSFQGSQVRYRAVTLCAGSWLVETAAFERYTWASRQGGPLVPLVYEPKDHLVFSNRGLWTKEDEWALSGDPRGSNTYYLGYVTKVLPESLVLQVSI